MKVCYVVSTFPRFEGDPEVPWLLEKVKRLRDRGIEVDIFAPSYQGTASHRIGDIPVYRFRYFPKRWERLTHNEGATNKIQRSPLYAILAVFYILCGCLAMIRFASRQRYDVFHAHWPFPHALFAWIGSRRQRALFTLGFYGAELVLADRFPPARPFLRFFMKRADGADAISTFSAEKARTLCDIPVRIIPYGAPVVSRKDTAPDSAAAPFILFLARLVERKGPEYLIRAMPEVRRHAPGIKLIIAGSGHGQKEIEQAIRDEGLSDCVELAGRVSDEDKDRLFRTCSLFVLPAIVDKGGDTEMLGVVFLEAMAHRKPVVGSRVGGIPDAVVHGETGLLVPEKDPAALADAIVRVLTEPGLADRLGEGGYRHLQEYFSWDRIADLSIAGYATARTTSARKRAKRNRL